MRSNTLFSASPSWRLKVAENPTMGILGLDVEAPPFSPPMLGSKWDRILRYEGATA
jgi:hypothetical protein